MAIQIKGLAPLLQIFDMPTSIHFYRDILGFEMIESDKPGDDCDWVLLRLQGVELMLNKSYEKQSRPQMPDAARISAHGDTAIYFSCPDIHAAYSHITATGMNIKPPYITGYGFKAIDITDPDGFKICFHWPVSNK